MDISLLCSQLSNVIINPFELINERVYTTGIINKNTIIGEIIAKPCYYEDIEYQNYYEDIDLRRYMVVDKEYMLDTNYGTNPQLLSKVRYTCDKDFNCTIQVQTDELYSCFRFYLYAIKDINPCEELIYSSL